MDTTTNGKLDGIFASSFLKEMKSYLTEKTIEGYCVTRTQVCIDLNLDTRLSSVIGVIINLELMPEFKTYMGPNGGIGRADMKPPKRERTTSNVAPIVSDTEILEKLEYLCGGGQIVSRKKIASALGHPGTKTQTLISLALKRPEFHDFSTKNGKGGGVYKISLRPDLVTRTNTSH